MVVESFIGFILNIDQYLALIIAQYNLWVYAILFIIIFLETGFVVTPFLPGDSLLFAAGMFAALGSLNIALLLIILCAAAILGDTVNYWIGFRAGPKIFHGGRFFKKEYLERSQKFYERHGSFTIVIARFLPIIRTFAPFVAGIGKMRYRRFLSYNIIGGVAWVLLFLGAGYFLGTVPVVQENFSLVIIAIIVVSIIIALFEILRHRK
jgi:membrane-associated protein